MDRQNVRYGDLVRIASGRVTVDKDERIEGEVVSILGGADIDGEVMRDVSVIAGPLHLGPNAVVRGDVTVVGGRFDRDPGATIRGSINDVGIGSRGWNRGGRVFPWTGPVLGFPFIFGDGPVRLFAATGTALRILLTVVLALIVIAVARPAVERVSERAVASPARAGLAGLLAELLFFPALIAVTVVLAVSVVGIPLLLLIPFAIGGFLILMLVGFTGAAYVTGNRVTRRFGREDSGAFAAVAVGVVTLAAVTLLAKLIWVVGGGILGVPLVAMGYLVEYVAWTIGFGAVILAWFEHRRGVNSNVPPAAAPITT
jgi:hypothetical protein